MTNKNIYQNIAARTGGDIYLGVVGRSEPENLRFTSVLGSDGAAP